MKKFLDIFTYKNIVTLFVFITVWSIMFLAWQIHITSDTGNRYQIVNSDNCVILLDKRTGLTWRNVWNNDKDRLFSDWEAMNHNNYFDLVPIGEQNRIEKLEERVKKETNNKKPTFNKS